jgi:HK97 family phage major capsid protein
LDKRLVEIDARKLEIRKQIEAKDTKLDLDAVQKELVALDKEAVEIRKKQEIAEMLNKENKINKKDEKNNMADKNLFETLEYRKAFMNFVVKGEAIPMEYRASSTTADNAAVIPTTVLNQIIEKLDETGKILPLVHRIAYPSGVAVPTSALKPTATWIAEGTAASRQKKTTANVTFNAWQLSCEVGVSFKAGVQALSAFETTIISNIAEAMTVALEEAIVAGDGDGKPMGIISTAVPAKQKVALDTAFKYTTITKMVKAIPTGYKAGALFVMNESTMLDFLGIVDTNGQPVARVNYGLDGEPVYMLMGKKVITTDHIPDVETAKAGDVVAFAIQPNKYVLNTAYDMDLVQYDEHTTRDHMYQSMMLADGKVADANGLVLFTKASV